MDWQSLAYAVVQVAHNFGAAAVVGGAVFALWLAREREGRRKLAWLVLAGWVVQGASGASFGAVSFLYYGKFPDIAGVAVAALVVKIVCAAGGFVLAALYLRAGGRWTEARQEQAWRGEAALGATALTAAAFLRWFA
ncbi:MAG: hypothetical protein A2637_00840 [Candidatus Muproteobacteria bacterium RIFCSPHIGHO2_01_FULL_65_16]|uniref:Copper resistance protein D domain-containing protein n=1 Tax=Candidatus Muproteobacteria bacterium RIFCSPHIGHO2_01_FULL_65_16 TaxID=1817764 RepID=A0A1F6TIT6_9PROT|nr:MAG: hypothetical protein A2637_00840 [Candidatus Muproteobacteria bacterium RIFCSPHIGHO2_01_FULL_65_16]